MDSPGQLGHPEMEHIKIALYACAHRYHARIHTHAPMHSPTTHTPTHTSTLNLWIIELPGEVSATEEVTIV